MVCSALEPLSCIVEVKAPLFELARAFSNKTLAEKYPARNRGVAPATATLIFEDLEKFRVTDRGAAVFGNWRRHDRHTVLGPLDRKALAGGYRIIIACRWWLAALDILERRGDGLG